MKRSGARLFCSTVTLYHTEDLFRDFFFFLINLWFVRRKLEERKRKKTQNRDPESCLFYYARQY